MSRYWHLLSEHRTRDTLREDTFDVQDEDNHLKPETKTGGGSDGSSGNSSGEDLNVRYDRRDKTDDDSNQDSSSVIVHFVEDRVETLEAVLSKPGLSNNVRLYFAGKRLLCLPHS